VGAGSGAETGEERLRRRVGLLGGSFNPAHGGHRYISELALKQLQLHQVWWVISPQNPLKASNEIAPLEERCAIARSVASHPQIRVTDIEDRIGTSHTIDTITVLQARFPDVRFVWLMGADILLELPQWKRWRYLFHRVPIAVYPRPTYSLRALSSVAARSFAGARVPQRQARCLAAMSPPAWTFLQVRPHGQSATQIRARRSRSSGSPSKAPEDQADQEDQARRETRLSPETQQAG
jgi:nicotinate-nucleotide adenylyltransferase